MMTILQMMRFLLLALTVAAATGFAIAAPGSCSRVPTELSANRRAVLDAAFSSTTMVLLPTMALAADDDDLAMPTEEEAQVCRRCCCLVEWVEG